jgi:hypothetical protein
MGMHPAHNHNAEQTVKEFVNRGSVAPIDDLNADTILTFSMMDEPLLLIFVKLNLWDTDPEEAKKQREFIDSSISDLHNFGYNKFVPVITPIDDSPSGNQAIRHLMGLDNLENFPFYPQLTLVNPRTN